MMCTGQVVQGSGRAGSSRTGEWSDRGVDGQVVVGQEWSDREVDGQGVVGLPGTVRG